MIVRDWFGPQRQLLLVFLVVAVTSTGVLAWLSWELVDQDRATERQRRQDDLDREADGAVAGLQRRLADLSRYLDAPAGGTEPLPGGMAVVAYSPAGFDVRPPGWVPYFPAAPGGPGRPNGALNVPERLEFQNNLDLAASGYAALAGDSGDRSVQATALSRLARVRRKQSAVEDALETYERLLTFTDVSVDGLPAKVVARAGRASILEKTGDRSGLQREAQALLDDISSGRVALTKAEYSYYSDEAARWSGTPRAPDAEGFARAEAVEWLWLHRPSGTSDRRLLVVPGGAALILWKAGPGPDAFVAVVAGPDALTALVSSTIRQSAGWSISDAEGHIVAGGDPPSRQVATRSAVTTGLPWTLSVFDPALTETPIDSRRRTLLLSVVATVVILIVVGWYFIWCGISREHRLARLQSDFVAAVSHEFRSPLTSLRHITDLLTTDRFQREEQRQRSYALMLGETDRLARLVEGLLDFGRFQSGAMPLRLAPVVLQEFIAAIIDDFRRSLSGDNTEVVVSQPAAQVFVMADREALARALWNLLDNAVKYSPGGRAIWIEATHDLGTRSVSIAVRDHGIGIAAAEQDAIFDRFVRGEEAKARRIRGTGIGLATVRQIMRAHDGAVSVRSRPGEGSTFTLTLPALEAAHVAASA